MSGLSSVLGGRAALIQARLRQEEIERDREERRMQMVGGAVQQAASAVPQAISAAGGVYNQIQAQKLAQAKLEAEQTFRAQQAAQKKAQLDAQIARDNANLGIQREQLGVSQERLGLERSAEDRQLNKEALNRARSEGRGSFERLQRAADAERDTVEGPPLKSVLDYADREGVFSDNERLTDAQRMAILSEEKERQLREMTEVEKMEVETAIKKAKAEAPQGIKQNEQDKGARLAMAYRSIRDVVDIVAQNDDLPDGHPDKIRLEKFAELERLENLTNMPRSVTRGQSASAGAASISLGAGASTGGKEIGLENAVKRDAIIDTMTQKEQDLYRKIKFSNRVVAKALEDRLTDADMKDYDKLLIKPLANREEFSRSLNDAFNLSARNLGEFYGTGDKDSQAWAPTWKADAQEALDYIENAALGPAGEGPVDHTVKLGRVSQNMTEVKDTMPSLGASALALKDVAVAEAKKIPGGALDSAQDATYDAQAALMKALGLGDGGDGTGVPKPKPVPTDPVDKPPRSAREAELIRRIKMRRRGGGIPDPVGQLVDTQELIELQRKTGVENAPAWNPRTPKVRRRE